MSEIRIDYENTPEGAIENSTTTASEKKSFVNMSDFRTNRVVPRYATLEQNYWRLNGTFNNFPDTPSGIGYMSTQQSGSNKNFSSNITITRTYSSNYTSPGFEVEYDTWENNYPVNVNIKWYRGSTLLHNEDFTTTSALQDYPANVTSYNKVVFTFSNMNNAYRYLKIFNISDGFLRSFYKDEIEGLELIDNIETKSLAINTGTITLFPRNDVGVIFQRTLPLQIYRDNTLWACLFIDKYTENAKQTIYKITANDYIGLLDYQTFLGGIYTNKTVSSLVAEILSGFSYTLDATLGARTVSGWLPITTKREALRRVIFAVGGMIDTSKSDKINITIPGTTSTSTFTDSRILTFENARSQMTTQIELTTHSYTASSETTELFNESLNGTKYLTFNSPFSNYSITGGTITSSGANYCIIQGTGSTVVLNAYEYIDNASVLSKTNSQAVSTTLERIDTFDTTLNWNASSLLTSLKFIKSKITAQVLLQNEKVGDMITINGILARIMSLDFSLYQDKLKAKLEAEVYDG